MKKSEKPASKETSLDDSIQLAIRDEVEKRFEQRENIYWRFGGLFVVVVALFFTFLWKVSVSEIRETVEKQLAEKEVVKARDRILVINSAAEDMNRNLIAISSSMNTNQQQFMDRLNQIKQQDNVVLTEDLSKLFVVETVTNFYGGQKIVLAYEPIPQTIRLSVGPNNILVPFDNLAYVEGNAIFFTNKQILNLDSTFPLKSVRVEYSKKYLR